MIMGHQGSLSCCKSWILLLVKLDFSVVDGQSYISGHVMDRVDGRPLARAVLINRNRGNETISVENENSLFYLQYPEIRWLFPG